MSFVHAPGVLAASKVGNHQCIASRLPVYLPDSYPLFVRLVTDHRAIVRAHDVDRRLVAVVVADEERKLLTARRPFRLVLDSRAIREHPHSARRKVDDAYFPLFRRVDGAIAENDRSEEHTSELQSLMRISYAVF